MASRTVLWLGGMSGVGKTTAARAAARRYDLWLYSLDARTYAHAEAMRVRALTMTPDELWVGRTPEQMVAEFEEEARDRFRHVLADLAAIRDDGAPVLVEGPQLLPDLVGEPALFVVAARMELQRELVARRGSFTFDRTSDPERAWENRIRRDALLAARLRASGRAAEVRDVCETKLVVDQFVRTCTMDWLAQEDRGDVAARRRDENDRRLDQWRRYSAVESRAKEGKLDFACECDEPGCVAVVPLALADAETLRASSRPLLSL